MNVAEQLAILVADMPEQFATVVKVALRAKRRTLSEEAALIHIAHRVDEELNANARPIVPLSRLAREAGCTKPGCKVCES